MSRILAVDPGEKNIGLALSDPFGMTAAPLCIVRHKNRMEDAQEIARIAQANSVDKIIVGQALNSDGQVGSAAKHARKVAKELRRHFNGVVLLWDESGSTRAVQDLYLEMGLALHKRRGHHDARAAAWILQDYLDSQAALNASQPAEEGG